MDAVSYWSKIDEARGGRPLAILAERSGVPQSLLTSCKQRKAFLSYENTLKVCRALDLDMNELAECDYKENDDYLRDTNKQISLGLQFWDVLEETLQRRGICWKEVSKRTDIPRTTISSAKNAGRTFSFDVTVRLLSNVDISPEALAQCLRVLPSDVYSQADKAAELKRKNLIRRIKSMNEEQLDKVIEYTNYIVYRSY